jgi:hypothetical protein
MMKVTLRELINFEWNQVVLYGKREDPATWRWDTEQRYLEEECLATASEVLSVSTPYESLVWEMEHEEGEEGYEEECEVRDEWMGETYNVVLPVEDHERQ